MDMTRFECHCDELMASNNWRIPQASDFTKQPEFISAKLLLIVGEIVETHEARGGEAILEELANALIRTLYLRIKLTGTHEPSPPPDGHLVSLTKRVIQANRAVRTQDLHGFTNIMLGLEGELVSWFQWHDISLHDIETRVHQKLHKTMGNRKDRVI